MPSVPLDFCAYCSSGHRVNIDWTIFWDHFWNKFLDHFIGGGERKHTISTQGGVGHSLSVLREAWKAQCYYSGWGERILRSEGWDVVLIVNTTD